MHIFLGGPLPWLCQLLTVAPSDTAQNAREAGGAWAGGEPNEKEAHDARGDSVIFIGRRIQVGHPQEGETTASPGFINLS